MPPSRTSARRRPSASGRGTAGRTPRRARSRWSRARPSAASSAGRAARGRPSASRPRTEPRRASRGCPRGRRGRGRHAVGDLGEDLVGVPDPGRGPRQGEIRRSRLDVSPIASGERVVARIPTRFRRSCRRRRSSSTPNTARRITSSVIACIPGWRAKRSPGASARPRARSPRPSPARRRASARRGTAAASACAGAGAPRPPSSSSDFGPRIGARTTLRPGAIVFSRSAANSLFSDGGSETKTTSRPAGPAP